MRSHDTLVTTLAAAGMLLGIACQATAQEAWFWSNPLPQGKTLLATASNPAIDVAVGLHGTVLSAQNGGPWVPRPRPTRQALTDVIWNGTRFVAVGTQGTILTSERGDQWTPASTKTTANLLAIGNNTVRTLVTTADCKILSSSDGSTWTSNPGTNPCGTWGEIVWAGDRFVMIGSVEDGILSTALSVDGTSWTVHPIHDDPNKNLLLGGAAWSGRQLLVTAIDPFDALESFLLRSADGMQWTQSPSPLHPAFDIAFGEGRFLLAGGFGGGVPSPIYSSSNGTDWMEHPHDFPLSVHSASWSGRSFVVAGEGGYIASSATADTWVPHNHAVLRDTVYGLRWLTDRFVATSHSGRIAVSMDGRQFAIRSLGIDMATNDIARGDIAGGERWVAVGFSGAIATSSDGEHWQAVASGSTALFTRVAHGHHRFVVIGSGATLRVSDDGLNWRPYVVGDGVTDLSDVAFDGSKFVVTAHGVVGSSNGGMIWTSPDGEAWTLRFQIANVFPQSLVSTGQRLIAIAAHHSIVSPDGIQWAAHDVPGVPAGGTLGHLAWDGRRVLAAGTVVANTTDGVEWTIEPPSVAETIGADGARAITSDGKQFLIAGALGAILRRGDDMFVDDYE